MNTGQLIADISMEGPFQKLTKTEVKTAVEIIFDTISDTLVSGDDVHIRDFGTFKFKQTNARIGRNPITGAPVNVAAKRQARLTMSKVLKDAMNQPPTRAQRRA